MYSKEEQLQNRKKWVSALRSGEYKQTRFTLKDHHGFCCLGVACDLFIKENPEYAWKESNFNGFFFVDKDNRLNISGYLPTVVKDWLGLQSIAGLLPPSYRIKSCNYLSNIPNKTLTTLNDDFQFDFERIATVIEENEDEYYRY